MGRISQSLSQQEFLCLSLSLLQALFFEEKTERQYADELGVYRNAVHARKMKVLKKLKAMFEDLQ